MPPSHIQILDNNGDPLASGTIDTYEAGTTTPLATYTDVNLTVAHPNPIVLDSAGRAQVFLAADAYKFVYKDSSGTTIRTDDNVSAIQLASSLLVETFQFGGSDAFAINHTSVQSGTTVDVLYPNTKILPLDSGDLNGTYALRGMMKVTSGDTLSCILVNLSDGAPDTAIVTISSTSTVGDQQTSGAITFAAAGTSKNYGVKCSVDAGSGSFWGVELVRTG